MKKLLLLIVLATVVNYIQAQESTPYTELVWSDEFDEEGLPNPAKWGYEEGYVRNGELQYYTRERIQNAFVQDGYLHLRAIYNDTIKDSEGNILNHKQHHITSASITSKNKGDWRYGRFEIRAKVPGPNKGSWPAIWLMPTESSYGPWPHSGEIDIMEHVGYSPEYVHFTSHTGNYNASKGTLQSGEYLYNIYDDFHTFILEWHEEYLEWYIDDKKMPVHEFYRTSMDSGDWPFRKIFYMILNLAYGGSWGGKNGVDITKLPLEYLVDYVRVYQMPTSSVNQVSDNTITLYPNPVKDELNISGVESVREVKVLSINGQELITTGNTTAINLESLHKGCYLIEVKDNDGNSFMRKVLKE